MSTQSLDSSGCCRAWSSDLIYLLDSACCLTSLSRPRRAPKQEWMSAFKVLLEPRRRYWEWWDSTLMGCSPLRLDLTGSTSRRVRVPQSPIRLRRELIWLRSKRERTELLDSFINGQGVG